MVRMGGAGRPGDRLQMVSRVSLYPWTVWMAGARRSGAGLRMVSRVSVGGMGCVGFVYKIVEMTAASNDNSNGQVLGLLCMERNGNFGSSHLRLITFASQHSI